jgi:hypothetical protein
MEVALSQLQAAPIFVDRFESGAAGTNIGAPWGINSISPATYQTAGSPFPGGNQYADLNDPGPNASPAQAIRLQSTAGNNTSLESSLNGQVTTFSFEFFEPTRTGDVNSLILGYYRQQSNPDLNTAGRNYSALLRNGNLLPQGTTLNGAATTYSLDTVHTLYMFVNDSASAVVNYTGTGLTLADTSADVWISLGGAAPIYAFSVDRQNATPPANNTNVSGVGFRTNNADIERFFVDNVLVTGGATFDRSEVPEPATWTLAAAIVTICVAGRRRQRG